MIPTIATTAVWLTQWIELSILIKATVMIAFGLAAARLAMRAPAAVRHLLLAVTFAALMALPVATIAVPGVVIQVPVADGPAGIAAASRASLSERSGMPAPIGGSPEASRSASGFAIHWPSVVRWVWLGGVAGLCLSLGVAVGRLRRIRRDGLPRPEMQELVQSLARQAGIRRPVGVLEHEAVAAPLTCGLWTPTILLPSDAGEWNEADLRRALVHELEHVRRGDWAVQLAARVACACYWFHPLVWVAFRQLCLEAERACDDAVLRSAERTDYADQLVMLARRLSKGHAPALLGMANRSDLAGRVTALLDEHRRRGRAGAFAAAGAVVAAGLAVTAIAPLQAIAKREPVVAVAEAATDRDQGSRSGARRRPRVKRIDVALYEAAESGDLAEVDDLLQAGANVNAAIDGDGSPLIGAARANSVAVVGRLLDRGADPNMPVLGDGSPLIAAAAEGAAGVAAVLLDRGALVDLVVPGDENALITASRAGHLDVVKLLVARGADVNARVWADSARERPQGEWRTPLGMARQGRHAAVVAFLQSVGARD